MSRHRDSACQKHALPKSLQGTEDAELIWSMILERFPNAAPLLCDMEALVDRAEDLLQQLRAPCQHETETSASFHTLDSEDSSELLSRENSLSVDNDNAESGSKMVVGVQYSEANNYDADIDSYHQSGISDSRSRDVEVQSNDSFTVQRPLEEKRSVAEKSAVSKGNKHAEQRAKEARSLEEWERVVDNAMRKSFGGNNNALKDRVRKDGVGESRTRSKSKEHREHSIGSNEHEKACVILHQKEKRMHVHDSTTNADSEQTVRNQEQIEINDDNAINSFKGSGDESSPKKAGRRTPLSILEDFAKRCNKTVVYDSGPNRRNSKVIVIRGRLCGFNASAQGDSEESAKNSLAVKMLQLIANWQMDAEKPSLPAIFSDSEMLEIIDLEENPSSPAHTRLYRLCLEKGYPVPTYSVIKVENSVDGLTCIATCSALGYTGEGIFRLCYSKIVKVLILVSHRRSRREGLRCEKGSSQRSIPSLLSGPEIVEGNNLWNVEDCLNNFR
ncbi:uncharacterized protein LOC143214356 isoform X2 [Lasioglossum baleicum]|uniref:uncharacterized protein LOC143214356 isoform X2 n=1 Tax=Lasioglossum baleicum TaxID=434251 RepID=UPI003FCDB8BA